MGTNTVTISASSKMLRLRVLLLLAALTTAAHSLKCWQTGDSAMDSPLSLPKATSLRSAAVPIVEVTCANDDTCMRKWWTVAKVSDVYYSLGCSNQAQGRGGDLKGRWEAGPVLL